MMKKTFSVLILFVFLLVFPIRSHAQSLSATLSAGSGSGQPGSSGINIPLNLSSSGGTDVAGINFDLSFDASRIVVDNITIGSAASSAGKMLSWSSPSSGKVRIIIFGLNQTAIPNGTVATLSVSVLSSATLGSFSLPFSSAACTDHDGNSVSLSLNAGSFTVNAPPPQATATHTPAPPTSTETPTQTPQPAVTMSATSTVEPVDTDVPTSTNTPPSTATRTVNRTATPTSTVRSGSSTQIPPTEASNPSETETAAAVIAPSSTSSVDTGVDSSGSPFTPLLGTSPPDGSADPLEAAVIATSTALARAYNASEDKSDGAVIGSNPDEPIGGGTAALLDVLGSNASWVSTLVLMIGIGSALMILPVAAYVLRLRAALMKRRRGSRSVVAREG